MTLTIIVILILLGLSYFDLRHMEIPAIPTYIGTGVALIVLVILYLTASNGIEKQLLQSHFLTVAILGLLTTSIVILSKEQALGSGDIFVSLIIAVGASPVQALLTVVFASWAGSIYGLFLYFRTKEIRGKRIPLIPFLTIGYICTLLFGETFLRSLGFLW